MGEIYEGIVARRKKLVELRDIAAKIKFTVVLHNGMIELRSSTIATFFADNDEGYEQAKSYLEALMQSNGYRVERDEKGQK